MNNIKWSDAEKKCARRVFDTALARELTELVAEFKAKAARVSGPEELWDIAEYLRDKQREIDTKYDYRYSQLIPVFGRLLREGRIAESDLSALTEEKRAWIRLIATL